MRYNNPFHGPTPIYDIAGKLIQIKELGKSKRTVQSTQYVNAYETPACSQVTYSQDVVWWSVVDYAGRTKFQPLSEPVG